MANNKPSPCVENSYNPNNSGVVLDVPMYEGSGNPHDVSSSAFTLTNNGGVTWGTGLYGSCLTYDGSSGYTQIPAINLGSGDFAIGFAVNPAALGIGEQVIIGDDVDTSRQWLIDTGRVLNGVEFQDFVSSGSGYNSNATLTVGTWTRVIFTRVGGNLIVYINGLLDNNFGTLTSNYNASGLIDLGRREYPGFPQYFGGSLDAVFIRVGTGITAAQAAQDYADWFARFRSISPIQTASLGHSTASTTASCSFGVPPTVGDGIVVSVWGIASSLLGGQPTVTDNQTGNTYTNSVWKQDTGVGHDEFAGQWLLPAVVGSSGTFTVTVTFSGSIGSIDICATEFNPGLTLDQTSNATGSSTAPAPGAVTTATANEVIVTTFGNKETTNPGTIAPPTGFYTSAQELNGATYAVGAQAYEVVSSTQTSLNPAWATDASAAWAAVQASYYVASGGTNYSLSGSAGSFAITGKTLTTSAGLHLAGSAASFALTGETAALSHGHPLSAAAGSFALTGEPITVSAGRPFAGAHGSFTLTGEAAVFGVGMSGAAGSFALTGENATLASPGSYTLSAAAGSFTLTGEVLTASAGRSLSAGHGVFMLTGEDATLTTMIILTLVFGDLVHQTSSTAGTGNLTLSATPNARRPFSAVLNAGDYATVSIVSQTSNLFEVNLVKMQADGTLSRGTPYTSSNGGGLVSFDGSTLDVFIDEPAYLVVNGMPVGYTVVVR